MTDKKYFLYLGCSGFPYGLAEVKKMTLVSKSLVLAGHSVTIISEKGVHDRARYVDLKASGNHDGIDYIYTSGSPFREKGFIKRNLLKVRGLINEIKLLRRRKKRKELDYAIISTHSFGAIVYYYILSKIFRFKTILNHVEYYSGVKMDWNNKSKWINDNLFDRYAPVMLDMSFPISEFLISHLKKMTPGKKYLKIPILAEFEKYNGTEVLQEEKYFLFSGAADYTEVIEFIIDSFILLDHPSVQLYLAIKGGEHHLIKVREYINQSAGKDKIKIFSQLNEKQLYNYYRNAIALLIPLRPTVQDEARFPHKIGEYLASGNPVISTNYGEVKFYFKDQETMLIAPAYDIDLFSAKMKYILDNPAEAIKIGDNGRNVALRYFDHKIYGEKIIAFLTEGASLN